MDERESRMSNNPSLAHTERRRRRDRMDEREDENRRTQTDGGVVGL